MFDSLMVHLETIQLSFPESDETFDETIISELKTRITFKEHLMRAFDELWLAKDVVSRVISKDLIMASNSNPETKVNLSNVESMNSNLNDKLIHLKNASFFLSSQHLVLQVSLEKQHLFYSGTVLDLISARWFLLPSLEIDYSYKIAGSRFNEPAIAEIKRDLKTNDVDLIIPHSINKQVSIQYQSSTPNTFWTRWRSEFKNTSEIYQNLSSAQFNLFELEVFSEIQKEARDSKDSCNFKSFSNFNTTIIQTLFTESLKISLINSDTFSTSFSKSELNDALFELLARFTLREIHTKKSNIGITKLLVDLIQKQKIINQVSILLGNYPQFQVQLIKDANLEWILTSNDFKLIIQYDVGFTCLDLISNRKVKVSVIDEIKDFIELFL